MSSVSAQAGVGSSSTVAAMASRLRDLSKSMSDTISEAARNLRRVRTRSFSTFIGLILHAMTSEARSIARMILAVDSKPYSWPNGGRRDARTGGNHVRQFKDSTQ